MRGLTEYRIVIRGPRSGDPVGLGPGAGGGRAWCVLGRFRTNFRSVRASGASNPITKKSPPGHLSYLSNGARIGRRRGKLYWGPAADFCKKGAGPGGRRPICFTYLLSYLCFPGGVLWATSLCRVCRIGVGTCVSQYSVLRSAPRAAARKPARARGGLPAHEYCETHVPTPIRHTYPSAHSPLGPLALARRRK